ELVPIVDGHANRPTTTLANKQSHDLRLDISKVHEYIDNLLVGQNQDIAKLMLGIFRSNPSAESGDDIYNIIPSLDFIISLGDNSWMLLITLAKKTAFLCALSSASKPSDLARLDLTTLTNTQNGITIQCINPKEINIAIGHGINKKRTKKNLRFTNEQRTAIFLSCISLHRPASIDSIANWLKDIIRKSAPNRKAKDIRVLLAMLAQNGSANLNLILALKNWSSLNTYQRFYQRGIKLILEQNNITEKIINQAKNI
ncbi:38859_t:CDS:2, partial [Gigaspora margarita]